MKIQKIDNTTNRANFGKIIVQDGTLFREPFMPVDEGNLNLMHARERDSFVHNKPLIEDVIKSTYNTPDLMNDFKLFVDMQKNNPVHIYLDSYMPKRPNASVASDKWLLKATVAKWFVFKQKSNPMRFLEDATLFADDFAHVMHVLKLLGYKRYL